jgi:hypothetical protein
MYGNTYMHVCIENPFFLFRHSHLWFFSFILMHLVDAFRTRYGTTPNIIGEFGTDQRLSKLGDSISVVYSPSSVHSISPIPIISFTYNSRGLNGWPADTMSTKGKTLVMRNPFLQGQDLSDPSVWRASSCTKGSPGNINANACN